MRTKNNNATGDCYKAAFKLMTELQPYAHAKLVHGIVTGQGPLDGVLFGHAWVELNDDIVIDFSNGHEIIMRKEKYYQIGNIHTIHRYTAREMTEEADHSGTYGPWDENVDI